uniref:Uncharacterized protein n=1 Tax=Pyxicephalus adspersus TaxID=30357 RepID=A0AAV2ZMU1_PYXAD|nr:TPA: hypothetical protein GDO54_015374 [Pyxicephalus adspersus]
MCGPSVQKKMFVDLSKNRAWVLFPHTREYQAWKEPNTLHVHRQRPLPTYRIRNSSAAPCTKVLIGVINTIHQGSPTHFGSLSLPSSGLNRNHAECELLIVKF